MVEREILNNVDIAIVGLYFVVILGIGIKVFIHIILMLN